MPSEQPMLDFDPSEIIFLVELNQKLSTSIRLLNKTGDHVFFKLLTTNPKRYGVRPRIGVLQPGAVCDITVTSGVLKEPPHNLRCKDRFMIRSVAASPGATIEDARNAFNKEAGHFHESRLRVVYRKAESSGSSSDSEVDSSPDIPESANPEIGPNDSVSQPTSPNKLLDVQPSELEVPCPTKTDVPCSLQLSNVTKDHVAFMVKTLNTNILIEPNKGTLPPESTCNITVKAQVGTSPDAQTEGELLIQGMVAAAAATTEDIQDMFDKASSPVDVSKLPVVLKHENKAAQADELILRAIIICLLGLISCYIMKQTLSLIWSVTMVALMLLMKMVKKLVSESVEDWVVKALLYLIMYVFGRKQVLS